MQKYKLELVAEAQYDYNNVIAASSSVEASEMMETIFKLSVQAEEIFVMVALNAKNEPIGAFEVSRGHLAGSIVHPREIFKRAILCNAAAILVAHNHPSGNTTPSRDDIEVTKRLVEAGNLMGIRVLDHIIVGGIGVFESMKALGYVE